jgi:acyl-CoA synthetase (AMP-forming)/AMP-acid ligase II
MAMTPPDAYCYRPGQILPLVCGGFPTPRSGAAAVLRGIRGVSSATLDAELGCREKSVTGKAVWFDLSRLLNGILLGVCGWTTLGDIGRIDRDGFLYLVDRRAFMIISGGVNIYPQEAGNILIGHPKVLNVAVIGVPNEEFGEEVKAVVQPVDVRDIGHDLEVELIEYCKKRLASFKCPRTVDLDAELPRHATGKRYKKIVRDRYWPKPGE